MVLLDLSITERTNDATEPKYASKNVATYREFSVRGQLVRAHSGTRGRLRTRKRTTGEAGPCFPDPMQALPSQAGYCLDREQGNVHHEQNEDSNDVVAVLKHARSVGHAHQFGPVIYKPTSEIITDETQKRSENAQIDCIGPLVDETGCRTVVLKRLYWCLE